MKVDRTPFTTFDFIGYFIPGFLFLYLLYLTFDIDFADIMQIKNKEKFQYEHIIFTLFMLIISWFVGHLLSCASHILQSKAMKIFDNNENSCTHFFDMFCQGKRNILPKNNKKYEKLLRNIYIKICEDNNIPKNFCQSQQEPLFLKSISYYLEPGRFSIIYNYLVIQGAFRAFTFSFILHAIMLCIGKISDIGLEDWVKCNFWYILGFDSIVVIICWNIYIKYLRRQIEENIIFLISQLYIIPNTSSEKPAT